MAGAHVTITVNDADVVQMLGRIIEFGSNVLRETQQDLGEAMKNRHEDRAAKEVDPDGVPWVDLSEDYAAYKKVKRPGLTKLKFDRHMLGDMFSYQADDAALQLGTNAVYGALQQWGGTPEMPAGPAAVPARRFLGLGGDDVAELLEILGEHLQAAIEG